MSGRPPKDRSATAFKPTYGYASLSYRYEYASMVDMVIIIFLTTDMDMLLSTTDCSTMGKDMDVNNFA